MSLKLLRRRLLRALSGVIVLLGLTAIPALAEQVGLPPELETYIARAMADWETPGLALAVVKDDVIVQLRGYGVRRMGENTPVDADTVFAAASITKGFTAAAIAMLVEEDKLNWNDRVTDRFRGFRLYDPWVTEEIRVRDLLAQRSGLNRGEMLWYYSGFDRHEILRRLQYLKPADGFRDGFSYHNLMFVVAGQVVANAAGTSWEDFVAERIFKPLGMTSSGTSVTQLPENVATPHARVDGTIQPIEWLNVDNIGPAGGLNTSARDLARWIRFLLNRGRLADRQLMGADQIEEMFTPHTPVRIPEARRAAVPETLFRAYGLGWFMEDYRGRRLIYHGGRIDGMSARLVLVPDIGLGVVVLTNRGRSNLPDAIANRVVDMYLGAPERDWSTAMLSMAEERESGRADTIDRRRAQRVAETKPSLPLWRYAGAYESELYGRIEVKPKGNTLAFERNQQAVADLEHWHYDTFLARFRNPALRDRFITFRLGRTAQIESLDMEHAGGFVWIEPPLPNDIAIRPPAQETPERDANFSGSWVGSWDGAMRHRLIVEGITDGKADVVYAWGRAPAWDVQAGGWERRTGELQKGRLVVRLANGATVAYEIRRDGQLDAQYEKGARIRHAVMTRAEP